MSRRVSHARARLRRIVLLVALLPVPTVTSMAQSADAVRLYEEGNQRLESGNYTGAVGSYLAAVDVGVGSAPLYYNLGIAYFRLDQMGQAIRYFERARRLSPDDRLILHNLEIARSKIRDRFARLPTPFWDRIWQSVVLTTGAAGLFAMGAMAWMILAVLIILVIRKGEFTPWLRRGALVSGFAGVLLMLSGLSASSFPPFGVQSVVIEDSVPLYSEVGRTDLVMELHEGTVVDILDSEGAWMRVRIENGMTGWLEATGLAGI